MIQPPEFKSELQRRHWFIENAEYFTVIRRRNLKNEREEHKTHSAAVEAAERWLVREPEARLLIYAVWREQDAYVQTVCR